MLRRAQLKKLIIQPLASCQNDLLKKSKQQVRRQIALLDLIDDDEVISLQEGVLHHLA